MVSVFFSPSLSVLTTRPAVCFTRPGSASVVLKTTCTSFHDLFSRFQWLFIFSICLVIDKGMGDIVLLTYWQLTNYPFNFEQNNAFRWQFLFFTTKPQVDFLNLYFLLIMTIKLESIPLEF